MTPFRTSSAARIPWREAALAITTLLGLATSRSAAAQGDVALRWDNCWPQGRADLPAACNSNSGESRLVLSFRPQVDVASVVGWEATVDFAADPAVLPDWWQVQPGGCRQGQVQAVAPTGGEGCEDPWSALGASVLQTIEFPRAGGPPNSLRLVVAVSVPPAQAFTLVAGHDVLACVIGIHYGSTSGQTACAGCGSGGCLVLNYVKILQAPGATPNPLPFDLPPATNANQATWAGGAACSLVPARPRTWGQIKAMYR